jgi:phosphonate transport system substrate-binding protein
VPPLCFGVAHNLPKDLRAKIETAFRDYRFAGSSADKFAKQGKTKFAPVNYEKDWKIVRDIDATLGRYADLP